MLYQRVCNGVSDRGTLIPYNENVYNHINSSLDCYVSLYQYPEYFYNTFKSTGTVAGFTDVTTDSLFFDFDSQDLETARKDAIELCSRLIQKGIKKEDLYITFTGKKGFSVEFKIDSRITPEDFKNITFSLAGDLKTFDKVVNNPNRIVRLPYTKHQSTGLYKLPMNLDGLSQMTLEEIKSAAVENSKERILWPRVKLPKDVYLLRTKIEKEKEMPASVDSLEQLNFYNKPKGLTNCKFAILNGFFSEGQRSTCLMALASTLKFHNYPKEIVFHMLKGAEELAFKRNNTEEISLKEVSSIVNSVFSPSWNGGQYSCKSPGPLQDICDGLGTHRCKREETVFYSSKDLFSAFQEYASNIDENTIVTGIPALDKNVRLTTGMSIALLGAPSSAKSSLGDIILNTTSKKGITSLFVSLDMYPALILQTQLHKHCKVEEGELFEAFKVENSDKVKAMWAVLDKEYEHVHYSWKVGQSVENIKNDILRYEAVTGKTIKLVLIDYLECLFGPYSDDTANSALFAGQLKDLAVELNKCVITLVQPQKSVGDPSAPITSMRSVKGASKLEQSFGIILAIYREGFNPTTPEKDKFITIGCVKNRMGKLFSVDCKWYGETRSVGILTEEEKFELQQLREEKRQSKNDKPWHS